MLPLTPLSLSAVLHTLASGRLCTQGSWCLLTQYEAAREDAMGRLFVGIILRRNVHLWTVVMTVMALLIPPAAGPSRSQVAEARTLIQDRTMRVSATAGWQDTGLTLSGESATIEYVSDYWRTWQRPPENWDGRGCLHCQIPDPRHDRATPLKSARHGSLIGRIGTNGNMFAINNGATVDTGRTGERGQLYLRINDTNQYDNSGFLTVRVRGGSTGALPAPPSNLRVAGTTPNSITLTWQDNSHNEDGFVVYRWDGSIFAIIGNTSAGVATFTDTNLQCSTSYSYEVSAQNSAGKSTRVGTQGTTAPCASQRKTPIILVHGFQGFHEGPPKVVGSCDDQRVDPDRYFEGLKGWLEGPTFGGRYAVTFAHLDTTRCYTPRIHENARHIVRALDAAGASPTNRAIIIAHSMGGLVTRAYVEDPAQYRGDVAEIFTFGTPHLGINYTTKWLGLFMGPQLMNIYDIVSLKQRALDDFQRSEAESFNRVRRRTNGVTYHLISGNLAPSEAAGSAKILGFAFGDMPNDGLVPSISGLGLDGDIDRYETSEAHAPGMGGTYYFAGGSPSRACLERALNRRENCGSRDTSGLGALPSSLTPRCEMGNFAAALKSYGLEGRASYAVGLLAEVCLHNATAAFKDMMYDALVAGLNFTAVGIHSPAAPLITNSAGARAGILDGGAWIEEILDSKLIVVGEEKFVIYPSQESTIRIKGTGNGTMTVEVINTSGISGRVATYQNVPVVPNMVAQVVSSDPNANLNIDRNGDNRFEDSLRPSTLDTPQTRGSGGDSGRSYMFPQTGFAVSGRFLDLWQGGRSFDDSLYINGFPVTTLRPEVSSTDGKIYQTQWFERARFEQHPKNPAPYDVLLGLLGTNSVQGRQNESAFKAVPNPGGGVVWFRETQHTLGDASEGGRAIASYWSRLGGLQQFGFPLSQPFMERSADDGRAYLVQYFERQRFEYHPEHRGTRYEVLLGRLGAEQLANQHFGPVSGQLAHQTRENVKSSGVKVQDFEMEVRFHNPYDTAQGHWDEVIFFRQNANNNYHIIFDSSRQWTLNLGHRPDSRRGFGTISNWNTASNGSNHVKLVVRGGSGDLIVNGQKVSTLNLSEHVQPGDITLLAGFTSGNSRPGAVTRYEGFAVRPLPASQSPNPPVSQADCSGIPPNVNMEMPTSNCMPVGSRFQFIGRGFTPGERVASWLTLPDGKIDGETLYGEAGSDGRRGVEVWLEADDDRQDGVYAITMEGTVSHNKAIGYYKILPRR
jgi:pimeloyl-ACP methyl ester carboxylesterase